MATGELHAERGMILLPGAPSGLLLCVANHRRITGTRGISDLGSGPQVPALQMKVASRSESDSGAQLHGARAGSVGALHAGDNAESVQAEIGGWRSEVGMIKGIGYLRSNLQFCALVDWERPE
jgi:hypothetical protein